MWCNYVLKNCEIRTVFAQLFSLIAASHLNVFSIIESQRGNTIQNPRRKTHFNGEKSVLIDRLQQSRLWSLKKRKTTLWNSVRRRVRRSSNLMLLPLKLQPERRRRRRQSRFHVGGIDLDTGEAVCANWSHVSFPLIVVSHPEAARRRSWVRACCDSRCTGGKCRCRHFPPDHHTHTHTVGVYGIPLSGWKWFEGAWQKGIEMEKKNKNVPCYCVNVLNLV